MGFFKDAFNSAKNWVVNTWNVSQHFDPYLRTF